MANMKQLYEDTARTVEAYPRVWLPVGSLYWNENDISTEISKYFVGTWQRVKDVFILAAGDTYTAKSSGGEATHTLTVNEMPSHNHPIHYPNAGGPYEALRYQVAVSDTNKTWGAEACRTGNEGGSQAHNNMPPYYTAYCWKRIS